MFPVYNYLYNCLYFSFSVVVKKEVTIPSVIHFSIFNTISWPPESLDLSDSDFIMPFDVGNNIDNNLLTFPQNTSSSYTFF